MSKNNGGDFNNLAAKRFKMIDKVDLMPQEDIYDILSSDIDTILDQVTQHRTSHGRYPKYLPNAFANISTPQWFYKYIMDHITVKKGRKIKSDLSPDEVESLRFIMADIYKKSLTNYYQYQTLEFEPRMKYLSKAFVHLCPDQYKLAKKLGLNASKTRELIIQVYGDPVQNMKYVCRIFDESNLSDKKKLKLLKKLYGKQRFVRAVGAAMTISKNDSDCIAMLFDLMMSKKPKKRAPYLLAYARAFKANKTYNFRMSEQESYQKNKKLFKGLGQCDKGFVKSYKVLKPKKGAANLLLDHKGSKPRNKDGRDDRRNKG